jgi:mRNA interferase HigB
MSAANPKSITELKRIFNSVDYAHGYTIFSIGGNNYRLISALHYNTQRCYVRTIMTHAEYSKSQNQLKLSRGEL